MKSENRQILKSSDIIIIDEYGMKRADLFDKINYLLQSICENDLPFG
jgi:hypothetical protein